MARKTKGLYLDTSPAGVYEIRWSENGRSKRRSTGSSDFTFAQKILANFILLKDRGEAITPPPADLLTVADMLGDPDGEHSASYWHEHVVPKVANKETAKFCVIKLLAYFGPMAVRDIMPVHVAEFMEKRRSGEIGKPSIDATIGRDLSVLKAAVNHAIKHKRMSADDAPLIERPPNSPPKDRWLSQREADTLIDLARDVEAPEGAMPRIYKFMVIALATGARRTAILELTTSQVDLKRGMIQFNPTGRAQTKKRRPQVPISDELAPIMTRIMEEAEDGYLLGPPDRPIRAAFDNVTRKAGLDDVSPHTFRHTWATWAAQAGVSLFDIAAVLGDTVATVERNYLHHCPEHLRSAVNAIRRTA